MISWVLYTYTVRCNTRRFRCILQLAVDQLGLPRCPGIIQAAPGDELSALRNAEQHPYARDVGPHRQHAGHGCDARLVPWQLAAASCSPLKASLTRYLCTSKNFLTTSEPGPDTLRLDEFGRRFIFSYRWVPTANGLRFEPVPNNTQAQSLRACHKEPGLRMRFLVTSSDICNVFATSRSPNSLGILGNMIYSVIVLLRTPPCSLPMPPRSMKTRDERSGRTQQR